MFFIFRASYNPHYDTDYALLLWSSMTEFCNNIFVTDCFIFTSNFNKCSPPRKDKHSKTLTGKYVVPHERIIIVNPNGRKQREIPEKESPGIPNPKQDTSWRQNKLFPRFQRDNSNKDLSWRQKEEIWRCQRKHRGIPKKSSPGISNPKGDPSWRQKEEIPR